MRNPCPDSRSNAANSKMVEVLFPAVCDLQSFGGFVFIVVLVGSLLLLAVCL
jgi:hypothetical protein